TLQGFDLARAVQADQFISLDAEAVLGEFMRDGWPDEDLFRETVTRLLQRARVPGRRVRAFGEMVALLWARGHHDATVRLEHLWHELCRQEAFALFCAYPRAGFTRDATESIREICD